MPNNLEIKQCKIDTKQLDLILQSEVQKLSDVLSLVVSHNENLKQRKLDTKLLNLPSDPKSITKTIALLDAMDIVVATKPRTLELIIKSIHDGIKKHVPISAEFVVPIYESEHWILIILSPIKQENVLEEVQYVLTVIDPACPLTSKSQYSEKIYQAFVPPFVQKLEDLSCEQQICHKEEPMWSSGHILIDNAIKFINGQRLVLGELCTPQYKQDLLDKHLDILKQTNNSAQKSAVSMIANRLILESQEIIDKYSLEISNKCIIKDVGAFENHLNGILVNLPMLQLLLNKYIADDLDDHANINEIKDLVGKLYLNLEVLCVACMQWVVKKIQDTRNKPKKIINEFFDAIPKLIIKKHFLRTVTNLKENHDNFVELEKSILDKTPKELKLDMLHRYFLTSKNLFICMPTVLEQAKEWSKKDFSGHANNLSSKFIDDFNANLKAIKDIMSLDACLNNIPDLKVANKLIEEEESIKRKQKPPKVEREKVMQKKDKVISFANSKDATSESNSLDNETSDPLEKLIESLKKTILNGKLDLQIQLKKVVNIENFAKDNTLIISLQQQLALASFLILSLLFSHNNISDISCADSLVKKVEELCDNIDYKSEAIKLNALVLKADLYRTLCLILDINCNKTKYNLVSQEYDRIRIVCTEGNAEQRFFLINQYTNFIDKMQACVVEINSMLINMPSPENKDALLFSMDEYIESIKAYDLTLQHYEVQNKLAELQRENFKKDFNDGLIKPLANGEKISNAALVQKKLSEQKQELNKTSNPLINLQELHTKCEDAVNELQKNVASKVDKIDQHMQAESPLYEVQNKLAALRLENFKNYSDDGLINPLANGEKVSNTALVQKKLSEQKQELNNISNSIISMQESHSKCENAVNELKRIVASKMNKIDQHIQAESPLDGVQNKLAALQLENFKKDYDDGLINPLTRGEKISNASVQESLSEQKQELNKTSNPIIGMQELHAKCENAVDEVKSIVASKMDKIDQHIQAESFQYLEAYLWEHKRKRRHSFHADIKPDGLLQEKDKRPYSFSMII
jgi:hypothetical protein